MRGKIKGIPEYVWYIKLGENYYIGPYDNKPKKNKYHYPEYPRVKFKIIQEE